MNAPLRRAGVVVLILFGLLFANLNWVQAYKSSEYQRSDYNGRVQVDEYQRQRGVIQSRDHKAVASNKATGGELKYLRTYPYDELYAHVVGYKPVNGAATGIERSEDEYLSGASDRLFGDRLHDMLTGEETPGGNVLLTISRQAQEVAAKELRNNDMNAEVGAVLALDPKTGAVQALVSMPSFDPNPLVSHNTTAANKAYQALEAAPNKPLRNRALSERFPPGSTFKVIDSAAALGNGIAKETSLQGGGSYVPPQTTQPINNAPGVTCGAQLSLKQALTVSCNTAFSRMCVERLSVDIIRAQAQAFGFGDKELEVGRINGDGLPVAESDTGSILRPDGEPNPAELAQACIGQANVQMTPLQGAMIAAAVANGGPQMRPYLVQQLRGADLTTVHYTANPDELRRPISGQVAADLQDMMVSVVQNGTGRRAQIDGYTVGGKTGTAQNAENAKDHGWFIGFAMKDGEPISAVCVLLVNAGNGGSGEAARIGGRVMQAVIKDRGGD